MFLYIMTNTQRTREQGSAGLIHDDILIVWSKQSNCCPDHILNTMYGSDTFQSILHQDCIQDQSLCLTSYSWLYLYCIFIHREIIFMVSLLIARQGWHILLSLSSSKLLIENFPIHNSTGSLIKVEVFWYVNVFDEIVRSVLPYFVGFI